MKRCKSYDIYINLMIYDQNWSVTYNKERKLFRDLNLNIER